MLYRDIWDQKPPGVHLTYAAGFALFGANDGTVLILDAIAATVACAFVFGIASRLRSVRVAWAAAIAFAIGTYPAFALPYGGFLERAVPETFITALAAAAAWCAVRSRFALAGLAVGAAALFKPTALVYWPVMAVTGMWITHGSAREARSAQDGAPELRSAQGLAPGAWFVGLRAVAVSGAAALVPIAAVLLWLSANHVLADARIAVVDYNRAYVVAGSSWLAMPNILAHEMWRLVKTDPLWCAAAFGGLVGMWDLGSRIRDQAAGSRKPEAGSWKLETGSWQLLLLCSAWLAAAIVAVAANGARMYATYFLPTGPPLALLVGSLFDRGAGRTLNPQRLLNAAVVVLAGIVSVHSHYPDRLVRYTAADIAQLRGTGPRPAYLDESARRAAYLDESARRAAYLEMFGGYANGRGYSARANDELASYLRAHSGDDDRIYVFGMAPAVYFDARRLPANRFVWTFPAVAPFAGHPAFTVNTLAADLERAAPRLLVLERNNRDSSTGWRIDDVYAAGAIRLVLARYTRETEIEDFTVMRRR